MRPDAIVPTIFATMNAGPVITVKDLKKSYASFEAVKGISFDVFEREIFGLLGPNGAGKTSFIRTVVG